VFISAAKTVKDRPGERSHAGNGQCKYQNELGFAHLSISNGNAGNPAGSRDYLVFLVFGL
jgi:hypothetical protein